MREFIYYSSKARTSGNWGDDLMKAGRMDIACQIVIMSFFISNNIRNNVKLHLAFNGAPDPPKHLEMIPSMSLGDIENKIDISKKDVAGLIRRMLYKFREGRKTEAFPGYFIEKKSILNIIQEMEKEGRNIYLLDKKGEDVRTAEIGENPIFILGDHEGIPKQDLKRMKKMNVKLISVGKTMYFASQTLTIVQNELDRREIN